MIQNTGMEKRASERIHKKLQVKFWSEGISYTGITTNVSENGMFVGTKRELLSDALLDMDVILPSGELLRVPVRVRRTIRTDNFYDYNIYENGLGVQMASQHPRYEKFVKGLKAPGYSLF